MFLVLAYTGKTYPAFQEIGISARAMGMGGAFVAVADDNHAILWNTAGLSQIKKRQISTAIVCIPGLETHDSGGIGYNFLGITQPIGSLCTVGFGWLNLGLSTYGFSPIYSENTFILSIARNLGGAGSYAYSKYFKSESILDTLSVGINIKYLVKSYDKDNEYLINDSFFNEGTSKSSFSIDAGLFIEAIKNWPMGVFVKNLTQPDTSISSTDDVDDHVPMEIKIGISYKGEKDKLFAVEGSYLNRNSVGLSFDNVQLKAGAEFTSESKEVSFDKLLMGSGDVIVKKTTSFRGGIQVLPDLGISLGFGSKYSEEKYELQFDLCYQLIIWRELLGPFGKIRLAVTIFI